MPCPIPTFEAQSRYLGEAWAVPEGALTPLEETDKAGSPNVWLSTIEASGREQDLHYTTAEGSSAWAYIRELVNAAPPPPVRSWLDSDNSTRAYRRSKASTGTAARATPRSRGTTILTEGAVLRGLGKWGVGRGVLISPQRRGGARLVDGA